MKQSYVMNLPDELSTERLDERTELISLNSVPMIPAISSGFFTGTIQRFVALGRKFNDPFWNYPSYGTSLDKVPIETQLLVMELEDEQKLLLFPIAHGLVRTTLQARHGKLDLVYHYGVQSALQNPQPVLLVHRGVSVKQMIAHALKLLCSKLGTFRLREEKTKPPFSSFLGWCTWDAFYVDVNEEKVLDGLESFRKKQIPLGFVILDDGWGDTEGDFLNSFEINKTKFPHGLKHLVDIATTQYGVRFFGVWHAFMGYWAGIHPQSALAQKYRLLGNKGVIRSWEPVEEDLRLIHPEDVAEFYEEFYRYLAAQGVNLVKNDGQSEMEIFTLGVLPQTPTMKAYQKAFQTSGKTYFGQNLIPCMCHASDALFHMDHPATYRNSVDYFPTQATASQQRHLRCNVMNNLWSAHICYPDWDMFQSHRDSALFHAMARCISGGPVYVCDLPHKQDETLLKKLCTSDGRILRTERPALPVNGQIFTDHEHEKQLLAIQNVNCGIGIIGLFHCTATEEPVSSECCAADIDELEQQTVEYACYRPSQKCATVVTPTTAVQTTLAPMESELLFFAPISQGIAPIGALEKLLVAGIFLEIEYGSDSVRVECMDGGTIGFYCQDPLQTTFLVDGTVWEALSIEHNLVSLELAYGKKYRIEAVQKKQH